MWMFVEERLISSLNGVWLVDLCSGRELCELEHKARMVSFHVAV